jgi:hypothetical protein
MTHKDTTMVSINDAFPSNYLKAADLKGRNALVTIDRTEFEKIGEDRKLILYFVGQDKGMVLNKTNASNIAIVYGDDTYGIGATRNWFCSRPWSISRARPCRSHPRSHATRCRQASRHSEGRQRPPVICRHAGTSSAWRR